MDSLGFKGGICREKLSSVFRRNLEKGGGGTFRDVNIFFSRFKVLVSSIDSKKRGESVSGALQQRL